MTTRIAAAALVACVVVAGCGGVYSDEGTTERTTTGGAEDAERLIAAPPPNGTTAAGGGQASGSNGTTSGEDEQTTGANATTSAGGGQTTETVETYDADIGYELRVSNAGGTPRNVTLRLAAVNDSAVAFAESVRLAANESREFAFSLPHAGAYEASVVVDGANVTQRWEVESRDPDDALSVHVSPEGEVYVGFVEI